MVIPGIKGMSLKEFGRRLLHNFSDDAVMDSAAVLSYYFLFSLFPFLFFLVALSAYLPLAGAVDKVFDRISHLMPPQALTVVRGQLYNLLTRTRPRLLTLSAAVAIFSAAQGVDAVRKALNRAYRVTESRPWWRTLGGSLLMTLAGTLLIAVALSLFVLGSQAGLWLTGRLHIAHPFHVLWTWLRWPFTALLVMFAAALMYYFLPDVEQEFKFITPGSVVGTLVWLLSTWLFTQYVDHFDTFNVTYGSIGGVIILMLWLYITGLILLVGGEMNAIIEHASVEGKAPGACAPGEPPPTPDGRPPLITPGAASSARSGRRLQWAFWRRRPGAT